MNLNYGANPGVMKGSTRDRFGISFTWTYNIASKFRIGNVFVSQSDKIRKDSVRGVQYIHEIEPVRAGKRRERKMDLSFVKWES